MSADVDLVGVEAVEKVATEAAADAGEHAVHGGLHGGLRELAEGEVDADGDLDVEAGALLVRAEAVGPLDGGSLLRALGRVVRERDAPRLVGLDQHGERRREADAETGDLLHDPAPVVAVDLDASDERGVQPKSVELLGDCA